MSDQHNFLINKIEKLDDRVYEIAQIVPIIKEIKKDMESLKRDQEKEEQEKEVLKKRIDSIDIENKTRNKINKFGQIIISVILMPIFTIILKYLKII